MNNVSWGSWPAVPLSDSRPYPMAMGEDPPAAMAAVVALAAAVLLCPRLASGAERGDYHDGIHGLGSHTCGVPGQFLKPEQLNDVFTEIDRLATLVFVHFWIEIESVIAHSARGEVLLPQAVQEDAGRRGHQGRGRRRREKKKKTSAIVFPPSNLVSVSFP